MSHSYRFSFFAFFALFVLVAALTACSDDGTETPTTEAGVTPPTVTPLTYDEIVDGCARVAACGMVRARLGDCVDDYYERLVGQGQEFLWSSIYGCVNKSKGDCGAIRVCLGFERKPKACKRGSYTPRCEKGVAYNCDLLAGWEQGLDCAAGGLLCGVKAAGTSKQAVCGGGPCDATKLRGECRNNRYYQCSSGAIEVDDCPARQLQCRDDAVGCEGTGVSCFASSAQCDAKKNILMDCVEGYIMHRDCTKAFGKKVCKTGGNRCVGSGTACQEADFDACKGDTLAICLDGYARTLDCKALGFIGCQPTQYGANCKSEPVY
ncbi:MAG: hypothetical protein KAI47_21300 [Deltaproteobacteria bacterium]|nr:hypothetical protein [Deltaproteobacteria bacterium]